MVFDLSEDEFFYELVQIFKRFKKSVAKERADLFALLMGLNHLREWISPGYRPPKHQACNPAQLFYDNIYGLPEWKTINELCNRTKHLKQVTAKEIVGYDLPFNQWPNVSSVVNFSKGPPTGFSVDGRDIVDIIEVVIVFYQNEWFRSPDAGISLGPNGSPPR